MESKETFITEHHKRQGLKLAEKWLMDLVKGVGNSPEFYDHIKAFNLACAFYVANEIAMDVVYRNMSLTDCIEDHVGMVQEQVEKEINRIRSREETNSPIGHKHKGEREC